MLNTLCRYANNQLVIGSRSHLTFVDPREPLGVTGEC